MMLRYTATCLFGLEGLLGEEIEALGCRRIENIDGRITFEGDETTAARASIALRFAERLYLNLGAFEATTFTALFDGTKALPWEDFIGRDDEFPVTGHAVKSKLFSVPDCQKIVKKAVSVRLRETLAAAMVKLARPREDVLLWDPFCGSGTIAIEAAMQMLGIAPGLRRSFAAEDYPAFPASSWKDAREAAQAAIKRDSAFEAYATDIDPKCVEIATAAAERAGVKDHVNVFQMDALDIDTLGRRGTVVTNPPYGDRLLTPEEAEDLYRAMGQAFARLGRWQIYVITQSERFEKLFGRRADKIRKLYNGMIPCYYYQFFKNPDRK